MISMFQILNLMHMDAKINHIYISLQENTWCMLYLISLTLIGFNCRFSATAYGRFLKFFPNQIDLFGSGKEDRYNILKYDSSEIWWWICLILVLWSGNYLISIIIQYHNSHVSSDSMAPDLLIKRKNFSFTNLLKSVVHFVLFW